MKTFKKVSVTFTILLCVISMLALAACGNKGTDFRALYNSLENNYGWTLGDDGSYLSADTNVSNIDDYSNSTTLNSIKEMNKKMGLPDSLWQDMLKTTWSMGRQEETFESVGIKVSWTYHPDKGLEVTYKLIG